MNLHYGESVAAEEDIRAVGDPAKAYPEVWKNPKVSKRFLPPLASVHRLRKFCVLPKVSRMRFVNKASLIFQLAQTVDYFRKWNLFAAVAGVEFIHHELHSVAVLFSFFALFSVVVGIWSDGLYCRKSRRAVALIVTKNSYILGKQVKKTC